MAGEGEAAEPPEMEGGGWRMEDGGSELGVGSVGVGERRVLRSPKDEGGIADSG